MTIKSIIDAAKALASAESEAIPQHHEIPREWESLTLDDARDGTFVTLPNGARMHYVTRGDQGSHVVLIHGMLDSTYNWRRNIDSLAQLRRVWAIDLIGFGFSSRLSRRVYTFKNFSRWVFDFMNAVEIDRATLVGHSLGGAVALECAHDFPQRVEKLILLDAAIYRWIPWTLRLAARVPGLPRSLVHLALNSKRVHAAARRMALANPARLDAEEGARRSRHMRVRGTFDALIALTASPHVTDLPRALGKISAPTLVLWGEKDHVLPVAHGERLVRALPNARLKIVKGAGHIPNEECPEIVNQAMLEFLRGE